MTYQPFGSSKLILLHQLSMHMLRLIKVSCL